MTYPRIYLAGKVNGIKLDFANGYKNKAGNIEFVATDFNNFGADCGCWYCSDGDLAAVPQNFVGEVQSCCALIAVLCEPDSYGSIAEIAWAASRDINCHVLIHQGETWKNHPFHEEDHYCTGGHGHCKRSPIEDAYWFVSNLPNVSLQVFHDILQMEKGFWSICGKIRHREHLKTPYWKEIRQRALQNAKYRCQLCYGANSLNVHHRTYDNLGHEQISDLTVLCKSCHESHHQKLAKN